MVGAQLHAPDFSRKLWRRSAGHGQISKQFSPTIDKIVLSIGKDHSQVRWVSTQRGHRIGHITVDIWWYYWLGLPCISMLIRHDIHDILVPSTNHYSHAVSDCPLLIYSGLVANSISSQSAFYTAVHDPSLPHSNRPCLMDDICIYIAMQHGLEINHYHYRGIYHPGKSYG